MHLRYAHSSPRLPDSAALRRGAGLHHQEGTPGGGGGGGRLQDGRALLSDGSDLPEILVTIRCVCVCVTIRCVEGGRPDEGRA